VSLARRDCVPCRGGVPPLEPAVAAALLAEIDPAWRVVDGHHLERTWAFSGFAAPLDFTVRIGALAEAQGHHPDLHLSWGKLRAEIWTHAIDGLTESDFILAAKIDEIGP